MLLRSISPSLCVTQYYDAASLLANAASWTDVGLVMLDLALPDTDGTSALNRLRELREDVPVVIISGVSDSRTIFQTLDAGAMGFIPKSFTTGQMLEALKVALTGNIYLPTGTSALPEIQVRNFLPEFTGRQWQVLYHIVQGKRVKHIAQQLDISESTVKTHVANILRELGCSTRTEAIVRVHERGLKFPAGVQQLP